MQEFPRPVRSVPKRQYQDVFPAVLDELSAEDSDGVASPPPIKRRRLVSDEIEDSQDEGEMEDEPRSPAGHELTSTAPEDTEEAAEAEPSSHKQARPVIPPTLSRDERNRVDAFVDRLREIGEKSRLQFLKDVKNVDRAVSKRLNNQLLENYGGDEYHDFPGRGGRNGAVYQVIKASSADSCPEESISGSQQEEDPILSEESRKRPAAQTTYLKFKYATQPNPANVKFK